ncbi:MAG: DUF2341 domain-containing protein, partial [Pseudomonadales bacterium]
MKRKGETARNKDLMLIAITKTLLSLATGNKHRRQSATCNVATESVGTCARAFAALRRLGWALLALSILAPTIAEAAWYDNNWPYRTKITIDFTKVTANLTNFPVLINLATDAELMANARADGFDILFTDDDETTKLDHERELYVSATGELVAWVRIPSLPSTVNKDIYMYYGYPTSPDQQSAPGVWSNGYEAVYHLHDDFNDATGNGNTGTNNGSADTAGKFGDAQSFDGSNYVEVSDTPALRPGTGPYTLEAWFKAADANQSGAFIGKWENTIPAPQIAFGMCGALDCSSAGQRLLGVYASNLSVDEESWLPADDVADGGWHHAALSISGSSGTLYLDGQLKVKDEDFGTPNPTNTDNFFIGSLQATTFPFTGEVDEVRISTTARSAGWIQTSYNNLSDP